MIRRTDWYGTILAGALICAGMEAQALDWPKWMGPNGDNHTEDPTFAGHLSSFKIAWEKEIGVGYSAVSVFGDKALAMGHDSQGKETVYCLNVENGEVIWSHSYEAELIPRMHKGGPNATPTIHGDVAYTLSKDGHLHCLRMGDGSLVWKSNLAEVLDIKLPNWGYASSPVLFEGRIFVSAGKAAALDALSGKTVWVSDQAYVPGYTTPVAFHQGGTGYLATMDGKGISILNITSGKEICRHSISAQFDMQASTPMVLDDGKYIFIGSNISSELLVFDGSSLASKWKSRDIKQSMNNSMIYNGVIYGIDGKQGSRNSRMVAVDLMSGELIWAKEGFGYGSSIGISGYALSLTESGELIVTTMEKSGFQEISRTKALESTCWTSPVYANGLIFVRNDLGHLICYKNI
ncbi:MAG: PQQ-like beta-propeller repeat protein [Verrucomicrobia bacterium]|nr:PQQ-like beta-propeller repeat protein [Verrucomicrobiota bacterium]